MPVANRPEAGAFLMVQEYRPLPDWGPRDFASIYCKNLWSPRLPWLV